MAMDINNQLSLINCSGYRGRRGGFGVIHCAKRTQFSLVLGQNHGSAGETNPIEANFRPVGSAERANAPNKANWGAGDRMHLCFHPFALVLIYPSTAQSKGSNAPNERTVRNKANFRRFGAGNADRAEEQSQSKPISRGTGHERRIGRFD